MELWDVRRLNEAALRLSGVRAAYGYSITGAAPGVHLGVPSPTVTLVVDLGKGLELEGPGLSGRTGFRVCVGGLHHEPYRIIHDGTQVGVQAELTPAAVRALFGRPVAELSSLAVELEDLAPGLSRELVGRVGEAPHDERAQALMQVLTEAALRRSGAVGHAPQPDAAAAWERIVATGGRVTVAELTERSGWSARYLTAKFSAEYGMGPKQAARLVRFDGALDALRSGAAAADVAADAGYADQAHLSRDMRDYLGLAPSAYLSLRESEFTAV